MSNDVHFEIVTTQHTNAVFEPGPGTEDASPAPAHVFKDLDGQRHQRVALRLTAAGKKLLAEGDVVVWVHTRGEVFVPFALYLEPAEVEEPAASENF